MLAIRKLGVFGLALIMLIMGSFAEGITTAEVQLFKFNRPIEHERMLSPADGEALLANSLELELSGKALDKNVHEKVMTTLNQIYQDIYCNAPAQYARDLDYVYPKKSVNQP